jgi:hypothetical protein
VHLAGRIRACFCQSPRPLIQQARTPRIAGINAWLKSGGKSPSEQVVKRLPELLGASDA